MGEQETVQRVLHILGGEKASVVLSDMAPKMTGDKITDHMASVDLGRAAAKFAGAVLHDGGWLITKIYDGSLANQLKAELATRFGRVRTAKPHASRKESPELYFVCSQFLGDESNRHAM